MNVSWDDDYSQYMETTKSCSSNHQSVVAHLFNLGRKMPKKWHLTERDDAATLIPDVPDVPGAWSGGVATSLYWASKKMLLTTGTSRIYGSIPSGN